MWHLFYLQTSAGLRNLPRIAGSDVRQHPHRLLTSKTQASTAALTILQRKGRTLNFVRANFASNVTRGNKWSVPCRARQGLQHYESQLPIQIPKASSIHCNPHPPRAGPGALDGPPGALDDTGDGKFVWGGTSFSGPDSRDHRFTGNHKTFFFL